MAGAVQSMTARDVDSQLLRSPSSDESTAQARSAIPHSATIISALQSELIGMTVRTVSSYGHTLTETITGLIQTAAQDVMSRPPELRAERRETLLKSMKLVSAVNKEQLKELMRLKKACVEAFSSQTPAVVQAAQQICAAEGISDLNQSKFIGMTCALAVTGKLGYKGDGRIS